MQTYQSANLKLATRFIVLRNKLLEMHAEPWNWPIANDPLFVRCVHTTLDTDTNESNIEAVTSSINRLILAIDGQIPTTALTV